MKNSFREYFKCPDRYARLATGGQLSATKSYFRLGMGNTVYGRICELPANGSGAGAICDVAQEVRVESGIVTLPFDINEVVENLQREQYRWSELNEKSIKQTLLAAAYYTVRPLLPVSVRKHLQRVHLKRWDQIPFPKWPVDRTVNDLFELLMMYELKAQGVERIPFVWFWPDGAPSAAIMTHDVETTEGRDFCGILMDIDDAYGIKSSFQVVPEKRYQVTQDYLDSITKRGFELAVQDLNHDGRLYKNREQFLERVVKINSYRRQWGAEGFRAGVLYRREEWFQDLDFSYDMSVPNVAHLDPQRGGCCTVMPYFIDNLLELPVTTIQDYSLFHILQDYKIDLWKTQIELIMEKHGLLSFIVHPDYVINPPERKVYEELLSYLSGLRRDRGVWIATPGEVNRWWRQRAEMKIVEDEDGVRIEGKGSERARIAYASQVDGRLALTVEPAVASPRV
jgi:hypothetical protein